MTFTQVQSPAKGMKPRASWAASVASAIGEHSAAIEALNRPGKWKSLRDGEDVSLAPFTVRLHKTEDDQTGQWEIYLPPGCCNVGGTCEPINAKAKDTTHHEDDGDDWYVLNFDQTMEFATTESESDGPMEYTNSFIVSAHAKPSAKMYGVDAIDAPARRLLWIGVRDVSRSTGDWSASQYPDSVRYKDVPGDAWSCDVAEIFGSYDIDWSQSGADPATAERRWRVVQRRSTPIDLALPAGVGVSGFDLVWNLAVTDGELEVKNLFCVRQVAAAAGIAITGDTMTDVLDASTVYARIDCTDMRRGAGILEVLTDPQSVTDSEDFAVWLPLYSLKNNFVTEDHRATSLNNVQLFHA